MGPAAGLTELGIGSSVGTDATFAHQLYHPGHDPHCKTAEPSGGSGRPKEVQVCLYGLTHAVFYKTAEYRRVGMVESFRDELGGSSVGGKLEEVKE